MLKTAHEVGVRASKQLLLGGKMSRRAQSVMSLGATR